MKNMKKGFTLIEIVIALAIMVAVGGLTITTLTSIQQAKMKRNVQVIKSELELTRNFAMTHGGQAEISIQKTSEGLLIQRTGQNLTTEEVEIKDRNIEVFYKRTYKENGDQDMKEYLLGGDGVVGEDAPDVTNKTLVMNFAQTTGKLIGPHRLDYLKISNGSRTFILLIEQESGMVYFDYEMEDGYVINNYIEDLQTIYVETPTFITNSGLFSTEAPTLSPTGEYIQPEINYDSRYIKIGGVYRAKDACGLNPYVIVFTLKDPWTTRWVDDTTAQKTLEWYIN